MSSVEVSFLEKHNQAQKEYFEGRDKPNMIPVATPYLKRHVEKMREFASLHTGERVLEVGCGMGRYTFLLADMALRLEGLDLSQILLDRLNAFNQGRHEIPLHCVDLQHSHPPLEGLFDVVLGCFTLHHIGDLENSFQTMARFLKVGGRIIFLEPNPYNPLYYLQILLTPGMTWKGDRGMLRMRKKVIFEAMRAAGLSDLKMERFGFFPPFVTNRSWGLPLEKKMEKFWPLKTFLPFQLFSAVRVG